MREVTTSEETSATRTGLRVLTSVMSPRMTRPPLFAAALGATVGTGTPGAVVAWPPWAGTLAGAPPGVGLPDWFGAGGVAGPHAAITSSVATRTLAQRVRITPRQPGAVQPVPGRRR